MALIGLVVNCIMRSMVSSVALGPTEQFRPIDIHRPGIHFAREGLGVGAAGQVAEIVDGDLRDDGDLVARRHRARR